MFYWIRTEKGGSEKSTEYRVQAYLRLHKLGRGVFLIHCVWVTMRDVCVLITSFIGFLFYSCGFNMQQRVLLCAFRHEIFLFLCDFSFLLSLSSRLYSYSSLSFLSFAYLGVVCLFRYTLLRSSITLYHLGYGAAALHCFIFCLFTCGWDLILMIYPPRAGGDYLV